MSYLLKGATLIALDPSTVERGDLRIKNGRVFERGPDLDPQPDEEVIELDGKMLMPGMVCAHTHLYSALARGMPGPPVAPVNFKQILESVWWRLDRALDEETIYWSAIAGALDAARAGTTCLFDHHASPSHIAGSLQIVREAIERVGLRGVLCYEVTDRGGEKERDLGLRENRSFVEWVSRHAGSEPTNKEENIWGEPVPLFQGMIGAHASFTLSDDSLGRCAELMQEFGAGFHIHVAEDLCDVDDARINYNAGVIDRLARCGAINSLTILAHGTHLNDREIEIAREAGAWFAHNPRSNMNNQVGYAPVLKFGDRTVLGTDGIGADMFEEMRFAFFKGRDARISFGANDWLRVLANNQKMASAIFGADLYKLDRGSVADVTILDYRPPTPVTNDNLAWHFAFGLNSGAVESVMVNGNFIVRDRRFSQAEQGLYEKARLASEKLWAKVKTI